MSDGSDSDADADSPSVEDTAAMENVNVGYGLGNPGYGYGGTGGPAGGAEFGPGTGRGTDEDQSTEPYGYDDLGFAGNPAEIIGAAMNAEPGAGFGVGASTENTAASEDIGVIGPSNIGTETMGISVNQPPSPEFSLFDFFPKPSDFFTPTLADAWGLGREPDVNMDFSTADLSTATDVADSGGIGTLLPPPNVSPSAVPVLDLLAPPDEEDDPRLLEPRPVPQNWWEGNRFMMPPIAGR